MVSACVCVYNFEAAHSGTRQHVWKRSPPIRHTPATAGCTGQWDTWSSALEKDKVPGLNMTKQMPEKCLQYNREFTIEFLQ